ncbi:hypothetical protein [Myroides pelagicus]|uniref:Phosphatase PAP2 family protein n=1 Tax=Myroides pelagicus TaxID=270914 RepID=A0A7K1GIE7_9FLAO|nr:hypothetical protein [Myroides pelagicus]MEC4112816.1 hypothetical protein [Myroides pelagicus]MTH28626.1 hypothetical protein [Myroides pelagicus]
MKGETEYNKKAIRAFKIISYILHPLIMPLLTVWLYFHYTANYFFADEINIMLIQIGIITVLLPISIYFLLSSLRLIGSTVMLSDAKDRLIPFAINIFLLIALKEYILIENNAYELNVYFWGIISSYLLLTLSLFFKIKSSVHMTMLAALTTFLTYVFFKYQVSDIIHIIIMIMLMGITGSARLYLKAHTSLEIALGTFIGIIPQLVFIVLN